MFLIQKRTASNNVEAVREGAEKKKAVSYMSENLPDKIWVPTSSEIPRPAWVRNP